ncbi:MAG: alpha/beta hydrolase, partial [Puniceicoccales bacterium]|nr:alpha/beta hydrolase [Puniceicoccales bacterium]
MGAIAAVCIALVFAGPVSSAESNEETKFPIWSDIPPGETLFPEKPETGGKNATFISNIWKPSIEVIRAPEDKNTGAAVLVCPGGGYGGLAYNHEGLSVAKWLNSLGVTAVILKYRVPARPKTLRGEVPLKDAQRALSLVRSKADEWKIDPRRLGILGFSAGGHLSALTSTAPERSYEPTDEVDKFSCVPDFTILIYPAYCVENNALSPRLAVT